jgi:nucleotide-binding universal stress UspA family protein
MAQLSRARVTLLHVIERVEHAEDTEDEEIQEFYRGLEQKARERFKPMTARFVDQGLSVEQQIVYGRRGPEIVRYTIEHEADLIVLSSHRIDPSEQPLEWATLSYQVSILCPCPVLLVK